MMRAFALGLLICMAWAQTCAAAVPEFGPVNGPVALADWQYPQFLPPRLRNHCGSEYFTGRPYCADHCGGGYQIFYCSQASFGCCHLGRGYCDAGGVLRCSP